MSRVWILGASDPEMEQIEKLLRECGETVLYAADDRGSRVTPGNMYRADCVVQEFAAEVDTDAYLVECDFARGSGLHLRVGSLIKIDHHRPGDPGHGKPPAEFLAASSLGQVISELAGLRASRSSLVGAPMLPWRALTGVPGAYPGKSLILRDWEGTGQAWLVSTCDAWRVVPTDLVYAAAADHCLGAAYRGECPGVDPDELMKFRAVQRAAFQGKPVEDILADIAKAQEVLNVADDLGWPGAANDLADMRRPEPIPELPEAATRLGIGYMSGPLTQPDGRRKFTCSGTVEQVAAWMKWAPGRGLTGIYGDPARGFAGGYEE